MLWGAPTKFHLHPLPEEISLHKTKTTRIPLEVCEKKGFSVVRLNFYIHIYIKLCNAIECIMFYQATNEYDWHSKNHRLVTNSHSVGIVQFSSEIALDSSFKKEVPGFGIANLQPIKCLHRSSPKVKPHEHFERPQKWFRHWNWLQSRTHDHFFSICGQIGHSLTQEGCNTWRH